MNTATSIIDAILSEEVSSSWRPGQPVPSGHRVVFGKLVKVSGSGHPNGTSAAQVVAHQASTNAWKAHARGHDSRDAHVVAAEAHAEADGKHPGAGHREAADQHLAVVGLSKPQRDAHFEKAKKHYAQR